MIRQYAISVTVAGEDASAVGSSDSDRPVRGEIVAVHVAYTTQPSGTDVVITGKDEDQPILTITNGNSDGWFYPRAQIDTVAGAAITAQYDRIPIDGYVNVDVDDGNAGAVDVLLLVDEG